MKLAAHPTDTKMAHGMCAANAHTMMVSLNLNDTPVGYQPAIGPAVYVGLTYNHKEASQPATFNYFNVGQKWTMNVLSFIQDDPANVGQDIQHMVPNGGVLRPSSTLYNTTTGVFAAEDKSQGVIVRIPASGAATAYQVKYPDGTVHVYAKFDGATVKPRRIFLSQIIDAQGKTLTFSYDGSNRLTSLTDAVGRVTTLSYTNSNPLLVTRITDPFARYSTLAYDGSGRLSAITDVIGITSSFTYDTTDPSFITAMTTPYGTRNFKTGATAVAATDFRSRWLEMTDPLGNTQRIKFISSRTGVAAWPTPWPAVVGGPSDFMNDNSYVWDAHSYPLAITKDAGGTVTAEDYTKAQSTHWLHNASMEVTSTPAAVQSPLERPVIINYPGQPYNSAQVGTFAAPAAIARVLDDGTTQITTATYNPQGLPLMVTDPVGRIAQLVYDTNGVDVLQTKQLTAASTYTTTGAFANYNAQHLPAQYTDAAGKIWYATYNTDGQLASKTDPNGQYTLYFYDSFKRLTTVRNTNNIDVLKLTYDGFDRVRTRTDSQGYVLTYDYDALDRVTQITYPDGTTDIYSYKFPAAGGLQQPALFGVAGAQSLDLWKFTDRQGRITEYTYDANRRKVAQLETVTVNGAVTTRTTQYSYYENGALKNLTDANGNVTHWEIDLQSRPISKTYGYGTAAAKTETTVYETTTSRVKSSTDAKGQVTTFVYNKDNSTASYAYTNAAIATAGASFTYDPYFARRTGMVDQFGTSSLTYKPIGTNGALSLDTEDAPFTNDTVAYAYDALGRVNSRTVAGAAAESFGYDALGRTTNHTTELGSFTYGYLGQTGLPTSRTVTNGSTTLTTSYGYDTATNDQRLLSITNSGVARSYALGYGYTDAFGAAKTDRYNIRSLNETASATHPWLGQSWTYGYDQSDRLLATTSTTTANSKAFAYDKLDNATNFGGVTGSYNGLNQISTFGGTAYTYDANGNLTNDGTRTYAYDAADRLISVTFTGVTPVKKVEYKYDGLGRRVKSLFTNAGVTTETRYLWCGSTICQIRNATDIVQKRLYPEGEFTLTGAQKLVTLKDQLGSVRDVVDASTGTLVGAQDYTPYGGIARSWGTVSPAYQYAGLLWDANAGLYLSAIRAYNPVNGKWLTRDLIAAHDYGYGNSSPTMRVDPMGTDPFVGAAVGGIVGGVSSSVGALIGGASIGDAFAVGLGGGLIGWGIGFFDPTLGLATIAIIGATGGALGDVAAQAIVAQRAINIGETPKPFNGCTVAVSAVAGALVGAQTVALTPLVTRLGFGEWAGNSLVGGVTAIPGISIPAIGGFLCEPKSASANSCPIVK